MMLYPIKVILFSTLLEISTIHSSSSGSISTAAPKNSSRRWGAIIIIITLPTSSNNTAEAGQQTTGDAHEEIKAKEKAPKLETLTELEIDLHARGFRYVIGCDDSGGAGCVAGPVVVASCCLLRPYSSFLPITSSEYSSDSAVFESLVSASAMDTLRNVNDCKALTVTQRQEIYDVVRSHQDIFAISVAHRSPKEIDDINLTRATQLAFAESIETLVDKYKLPFEEIYAIVDGKVSPKLYASQRQQSTDASKEEEQLETYSEQQNVPNYFSVRPYVNGDAEVYTVALASIIARVERDSMMQKIHEQHPLYGFADHSGYGRRDHIEAIHRLGSIEGVHRMSFKQVKGR
eukprot:CAMPEP_0181096234 /NCGR_PEP_ID=MMETSP1071-20121207/10925_1 /TAXON_ID=35127 /ORGANISM="Thalassiosira sp., Strain NH16" /LENGTH=346 /DNA_ID=CAMNT_0023178631 /DNA_START=9 /DNA_END=1050 /DNA_ORIENTATION=+